ncbi:LolE ABC-type transport system, involved in lipoprotein release, permease component [Spirosomataceae bacterium]|jgi:lipoprotein-releasing system permease protein
MKKYKHNIDSEIAYTHLFSKKKQTLVAALGVTVGIAIFIFMNSLMNGFEVSSVESLFKSTPHLRIYKNDALSKSLVVSTDSSKINLISNPKITSESKKIVNPIQLLKLIKNEPEVVGVTPSVSSNVFYKNGDSEVAGRISGVVIEEQNAMFNLQSYIVDGHYSNLSDYQNGIIIGVGIAEKLNLKVNDNLTVTSAMGVNKLMKIVALLQTGNANIDKTLAYVNLPIAQQLQKQNPSYITDIYVNFKNYEQTKSYISKYQQLTGYDIEDWETANAAAAAANKMRKMMAMAISMSIMLVAAFGIYNILNMTIMEKLNDIAILKALGFSGKDIVKIFVTEAIIIGLIGIAFGLVLAVILINLMSNMWVGGDVGFFPIRVFPKYFGIGIVFGLVVTFLAGYLPARKAALLDPISIFRK